jgi:hypothetical protein
MDRNEQLAVDEPFRKAFYFGPIFKFPSAFNVFHLVKVACRLLKYAAVAPVSPFIL